MGGGRHIELHRAERIQNGYVRGVVELYSKSVSGRIVKASRIAIGATKNNQKKGMDCRYARDGGMGMLRGLALIDELRLSRARLV